MATPPRLTELKCPGCSNAHWEIDHDHRGMHGEEEPYESRLYQCPTCVKVLSGFQVLRQSPPGFLLQPSDSGPMTRKEFRYWLGILKEEFPDHPRLQKKGRGFYPRTPRQAHVREPAVLEMTDEESSLSVYPERDTAMEWFDLMEEPGAFLGFSHKNGGDLTVTLSADETFDALYRSRSKRTRKRLQGLDQSAARNVILKYLHGKGWRLWLRTAREVVWFTTDEFRRKH